MKQGVSKSLNITQLSKEFSLMKLGVL